jgi:(2Fe-2S) ferredoxin
MGKDRTTPEVAAASFGIGKLRRHLLMCAGPDCASADDGAETWDYIKKRMKELELTGPNGYVYRTKCTCLRICTRGPIVVVYPEGAWYRDVTPKNAERILQEHVIRGRIVESLCFAKNPMFLPARDPDKL